MLANTQDMIQMCSFDATKSTRGASKLRRDLINAEIANLRDLLPLPPSTRQRLSQLQLMALVCVYVRKANYFQQVFRKYDVNDMMTPNFGFSKAMSGFLMMMTQNGKLLYISDNAAEYLGHSMEDLLIHGDSVYDIIDKQDHQAIHKELTRGSINSTSSDQSTTSSYTPRTNDNDDDDDDERFFLCRMNVSRNARRQMRFGDQKVVLMQGHFLSFLPLCSRNEPVFLATCTPVAMPETRECVVQGSTNIFTSIHTMDMKFVHLDRNGEFHLGYNKEEIQGTSWYQLIHSESIREAQSKHRMITQTEQDRACILLLRLRTNRGSWMWLHVVLQVKDNMDGAQHPVIVSTNQVLSEKEATVMRNNSWLYHYYTVQSKLQYSLALQESQATTSASSRTQLAPTYYHQQLMGYPPQGPLHPNHPNHQPHQYIPPEVALNHHGVPHQYHHPHHPHPHPMDFIGTSLNETNSTMSTSYAFGTTSNPTSYNQSYEINETSHKSSPSRMTSLSSWSSGSVPRRPSLTRSEESCESSSVSVVQSRGSVQLLSSPSVHPIATNSSMRAKYERKMAQLDMTNRDFLIIQDDVTSLHCVPSPTDPHTVPDMMSSIILANSNVHRDIKSNTSEQYVPEVIPMGDFYASWNHHRYQNRNHYRKSLGINPEVVASDGETVSLHTSSPSPTYSYSTGSPDVAVPHTPDVWPFTTMHHHIDDTSPKMIRKRLKVTRNHRINEDHQNGDLIKCTCHVDTCAPKCPCLRLRLRTSNTMTNIRRQCCTLLAQL